MPAQATGRPRRYCSRSCQARAYRRRRDRGRLDRAGHLPADGRRPGRVLEVALDLADRGGQEAVTLSAVAAGTGRSVAAVQAEVGSRDQLIAMLVQSVVASRRRSLRPAWGPEQDLHRLASAEWDDYRDHPWLVEILASTRPPLVPAVLEASRDMVEAFRALGLDTTAAHHRYLALSGYIQGMALLLVAEQRETGRTATAYRTWWADEVHRLDRSGARIKHAWLSELTEAPLEDSFDVDRAFRDGLGPVLRGLTEQDIARDDVQRAR